MILIDGDLVAYRCAATCEGEPEDIAWKRTNDFVERLLVEVGHVQGYPDIYLSGPGNFRYGIFPEYKVGRVGKPRPQWEKSCKEFLIDEWGAEWCPGMEADDMLAIRQTVLQDNSIIVSIDKDMKQVPGWHYKWEQVRLDVVISQAERFYITPEEGLRNFYTQLIVGDSSDGIKGVVGCGKKAALPLQEMIEEKDMFNFVREMYGCDEEMLMNGQVLWLLRYPDKVWEFPTFE